MNDIQDRGVEVSKLLLRHFFIKLIRTIENICDYSMLYVAVRGYRVHVYAGMCLALQVHTRPFAVLRDGFLVV